MLGFVNHLNLKRHATIVTHKVQVTRRKKCRNGSFCIGSGGTCPMSLFWLLMKKVVIYDSQKLLSCMMGNVGSSISEAHPILEGKNLDLSQVLVSSMTHL